MTMREWNALVSLTGVALVGGWLVNDALSAGDLAGTAQAVAWKLIWAIGVMIVFNIVAGIIFGIFAGSDKVDAPADERERAIETKSARNSNLAVSIGGVGALLLFAFGFDPVYALYAIFAALTLGGVVDAASQLILYRVS